MNDQLSAPTASQNTSRRHPLGARRRTLAVTAAVAAASLLLAACAQDSPDDTPEPEGGVENGGEAGQLRVTWWGADTRHRMTQEVLDMFTAETGVEVIPQFGEWGTYWDTLSTTFAANDSPDVLQMDEAYLSDYASRDSLVDFTTTDLNTADFDPTTLATGEYDGGLYAISAGVNAFPVVANPAIFEAAGVDLPDDSTWTWEDYFDISLQISENTGENIWGSQSFGNEQAAFIVWAHQHGESLFDPEGGIAFTEETAESFFQHILDMQEAGAVPPATITAEEPSAGLEQGVLGSGRVAMGWYWSNQLVAASEATGEDLVLLRMPSRTGNAADAGMYYKSSQYWSVSAQSDNPQDAVALVDFLVNNPDAGQVLLAERGVPPNLVTREAITPSLESAQLATVDFIEGIADEVHDPPMAPPAGAADLQPMFQRYCAEVLFEQLTPAEAAAGFAADLEAMHS